MEKSNAKGYSGSMTKIRSGTVAALLMLVFSTLAHGASFSSRLRESCQISEERFAEIEKRVRWSPTEVDEQRWLEVCKNLKNIGVKDISSFLMRSPGLLVVRTRIDYAAHMQRLRSVGFADPLALVEKFPAILGYNFDNNIQPKLKALADLGFSNPVALVLDQPGVLGHSVDDIRAKIELLLEMGFKDPVRITELCHGVLGYSFASLREKVQNLHLLGFQNPLRMIERHPAILTYSTERLEGKVKDWLGMGFDSIKALERYPMGLSLDIRGQVASKLDWLRKIGFKNPNRLIDENPSLLGYSRSLIEEKMAQLEVLGFTNPIMLVEKRPTVLNLQMDKNISFKLGELSFLGFESPVRLVESYPALIALSMERNVLPTLLHLRDQWGFSVADMESNPMILGVSLARVKDVYELLTNAGIVVAHLPRRSRIDLIKSSKADALRAFLEAEKVTEMSEKERLEWLSISNNLTAMARGGFRKACADLLITRL